MISTAADFVQEMQSCTDMPERFKWKVIYGKVADMLPVPEKIEEMLHAWWEGLLQRRKERVAVVETYYNDWAQKEGFADWKEWWTKKMRVTTVGHFESEESFKDSHMGQMEAPLMLANELWLQAGERDYEVWKSNSKIAKIVKKIWKI